MTTTCPVCIEPFTGVLRKPISCAGCDYKACQACYKTFLTSDGVSRPKCMNCNTDWTKSFLRETFTDTFIKGDLRQHQSKILYQQQIAMLPATQPAVERHNLLNRYKTEIDDVYRQIKELEDRKHILLQDVRILKSGGGIAQNESSSFQHKCCDPECRGFVSSAWKCGVCNKFSCSKCHELKGATTAEIEAHECNPDTVQTVQLLRSDTKPCPSCGIYIHKTEGCDQMFCVSCKQLWSWRTGRIEENGHNPHYLQWKRSRGEMARDPADIQCGREIDWRVIHRISALWQQKNIDPAVGVRIHRMAESLIHVRMHDIPTIRRKAETQTDLEKIRIQYMLKEISDSHFQTRIFQIQRNAAVFTQVIDLLGAVLNAGTDILYRLIDTLDKKTAPTKQIEAFLEELHALQRYANECLKDIHWDHSKTQKFSFSNTDSFALFMV